MDHFISLLPFKRLLFGGGERRRETERGTEKAEQGLRLVEKVGGGPECQINCPSFIWRLATPLLPRSPLLAFYELLHVAFFFSKLKGFIYSDQIPRRREMV